MKKNLFSTVLLTAVLAGLSATEAPAQTATGQSEEKTRKTPALTSKVYEKLSSAQKAVDEESFASALSALNALAGQTGKRALNSYELANVFNLKAFVLFSQDKLSESVKIYRKVIAQPDIPLALEQNTRFTISQILMMQEQWQPALQELNKWFKLATTVGSNAFVMRAQVHYQLQNHDRALRDINKAISLYENKGKVAKEQWLSLARFLYHKKGNLKAAVTTLNKLLIHYPKKMYWLQLAYLHSELGQEKKQLSALESAYIQGLLDKEKELTNLAYLYLNASTPHKAAVLLEKAINNKHLKPSTRNLELLANAWRQAQELDKAVDVMEKVAPVSDKGELWIQLGNIYFDSEHYDKAIQAFKSGLAKEGVRRTDLAQMSLGMAQFNQKEYQAARRSFLLAKKDKRSTSTAKKWLTHLKKTEQREAALQ
ncbi:hypothetical protein EOPP23_18540 [Endozoicomonas sp. OPT23]|uniref:tetratricopeptide repeat protein n=1 Tax=Endozoicomonas sp. OPT23 TaxID=2072845 RepID=UPI00129AD26C|nr:tetratricopeptide repeat protein [Endozoicomonas sp. OPT23]MRI34977.1 hypothetical protein [Endozoicomonas sp. OPT23]